MKIRLTLIALIVLSTTVLAQRTQLKPSSVNAYSPADDVKLGQQVAREAEKELNLVTDRDVTNYVATLGQRLVARAPNDNKFPFTFKVVDDKSINAFALPGGPIYVNRGALEAADNESQIAGVIGHEIAHVILRHGTNQATKGQAIGGLAGLVGAVFGDSRLGQVASLGGVFAANSVLLKYSRDAESQADLMGTQILYDSGYEPRAMAEFFDKLAKEHKGSSIEQFFSNHPIPENRVTKVNEEIRRIGPAPANARTDSPEFQGAKRTLLAMPNPRPRAANNTQGARTAAPPAPSSRMISLQVANIQLQHPDNWKPTVNGTNVVLAPAGGANERGLGYGFITDVYKPQNVRSLDEATRQFLEVLRKDNPNMKIVRSGVQGRVDNRPAQLTEVTNDSPFGGTETDIVVTLFRTTTEMQYFVWVAPANAMPQYRQTFQNIMNSVRIR
jgi:Zn-dependent protease with chaperone function